MNDEKPTSERRAPRFVWSRIGLFLFFSVIGLFALVADRRSGHILASVTGVACLLLVIVPPVRIAGRFVSPLLMAPVAWFASIVIVELVLPPRCSAHSVEREAAPIIRQLDEYRRIHGRYPTTLDAAGIIPPRYRCGTFTYSLGADGSCGLFIGDYALDDFWASWNSNKREWYLDT